MKRTFQLTISIEFDDDEDDSTAEDIRKLTEKQIGWNVQAGLESNAAYDLFGESLAMAGLQTPQLELIEETVEE